MKKTHILILGLLVVIVTAVVVQAVRYLPRVVPYWQCSEVYKRYSKVEGVRATYVKDYRLNDTLTVAATLLEATDSAGWVGLQEDFELPVIQEYKDYYYDSNKVALKQYTKSNPLYCDGDTITNDLIAISYFKHTICHFVIQSKEQKRAIIFKHLDDNIK